MNLRDMLPADLDVVGPLLHDVFRRAALEHGAPPPWRDAAEARALAELYLGEGAVVAESGRSSVTATVAGESVPVTSVSSAAASGSAPSTTTARSRLSASTNRP